MAGNHGMQAAPTFHADHRGNGFQQVGCAVKSMAPKGFKTQLVTSVCLLHKCGVARPCRRIDTQHLGAHALGVAAVIEVVPICEADPVKGIYQTQIYVVSQLSPSQCPQLLQ